MFAWSLTLMALACATEIDFYSDDDLSLLQLRASASHNREEQEPTCRYVEGTMEKVTMLPPLLADADEAKRSCTDTPECVGIFAGGRMWGRLKDCGEGRCFTLSGDGSNRGITSVQEKDCSADHAEAVGDPVINDEAGAVGDPHVTLANGGAVDMCCKNGHCEPCSSLQDSVTLGHTDESNDEQDHPHHRGRRR